MVVSMAFLPHLFFTLLFCATSADVLALSSSIRRSFSPQHTVALDNARIIGRANGTTVQYLGIPFAQPP